MPALFFCQFLLQRKMKSTLSTHSIVFFFKSHPSSQFLAHWLWSSLYDLEKDCTIFLFNISLDNVVEMLEDSAIVPGTLFEIYWVILHNMGHICKIADSSQLIFSLLLFLLKALMCAFFRAPIHDFVDLLIRQQFALTNNSMMTPLWMNPPVAPKLKGN